MCNTCGNTLPNKPSCNTCPTTPTPSCSKCNSCGGQTEIPHRVVSTLTEASIYCNSFVTVEDENAVYHIDANGNAVAVSRNPLYIPSHTAVNGLYKSTTVYDFVANKVYVYDTTGTVKQIVGGLV